jgi:hypothetical protein
MLPRASSWGSATQNSPIALYFEDPGFALQLDVDLRAREDVEAAASTERMDYLKQMSASDIIHP